MATDPDAPLAVAEDGWLPLQAWLDCAGIATGPVFRETSDAHYPMSNGGRCLSNARPARSVALSPTATYRNIERLKSMRALPMQS